MEGRHPQTSINSFPWNFHEFLEINGNNLKMLSIKITRFEIPTVQPRDPAQDSIFESLMWSSWPCVRTDQHRFARANWLTKIGLNAAFSYFMLFPLNFLNFLCTSHHKTEPRGTSMSDNFGKIWQVLFRDCRIAEMIWPKPKKQRKP